MRITPAERGNVGPTCEHKKEAARQIWQASNPDTVIRPGMFIKKGFTHEGRTEHMWVKVTGEGTGLLWNDPVILTHMHDRQPVTWSREEIQQHMV